MDIRQLFENARRVQTSLQEEMQRLEVEADSGGGMVRARMNGRKELISLDISAALAAGEDPAMIQDLAVAAVNACGRKVDQAMASRVGSLSNLLPGLF